MHEGGCECGVLRYRMAEPIFVNCCHCRMCQRLSGTAFAMNAMIEADRVELMAGAAECANGETHCPSCRVVLWTTHRMFGPGLFFVRVGTLDQGERLAPDAHFFTRSKHPWITLSDDVPAFDALPKGDDRVWSDTAQERVAAALAGSPDGG